MKPSPLLLGTALIVALGGGYYLYGKFTGGAHGAGGNPMAAMMAMGGLPVEVAPVEQKTFSTTLEVVGQLQAEHGVTLKSEISGRVKSIPQTDGTHVKAGTLLIQFDDSTQQAALAQAEANLAVAEANVGRYQRLAQAGAASQLQLDTATAEAKLARANTQAARAGLAKTRITAPFGGTTGLAQVTVGEMVQPGQSLVNITDNTRLKVIITLPEADATHVQPGTPVTLQTEGSSTAPLAAKVTAIENRIDPTTRTVAARIGVGNESETLKAGQFVRVQVPTQTVEDALVIPDNALVAEGPATFVFVVQNTPKGTIASRTTVTVGLRRANEAQITHGLQPGQTVVTAGQQKMMAPVMPVKPLSPTVVTRSQPAVEQLAN